MTPPLLLLLSISVLVLVKKNDLDLAHYWDEAFPYSYAIGHMSENGPGILTDTAPAVYTTGHPLLYYFLQSSWNNISNGHLWIERLFPMGISISILFLTYALGKHIHSKHAGGIAALLLANQGAFLAQASFQLPETLLTFFLLLVIYFNLKKINWAFILAAIGLVFTKETGVVLLFLLFIHDALIKLKLGKFRKFIANSWIYALPVALNFLFYLHQFQVQGWFLFPRHTGFMLSDSAVIADQFSRYFAHLFIYEGRNVLFFSMLLFSIVLSYNAWRLNKKILFNSNSMLLMGIIFGFLMFSAFNFYSNRYILCLFPLFSLLLSHTLLNMLSKKIKIACFIALVLGAISLIKALDNSKNTDHSLAYSDAVRAQMSAIKYCTNMNWQNRTIRCGFLMAKNLESHYPRYVNDEQIFNHINKKGLQHEILIVSSTEPKEAPSNWRSEYRSIKRFESGNEWCEILTNPNSSTEQGNE
ncbi:MAG: glycosyltransferase family 39 protein [Bacteroidota bacterium]